MQSVRSVLSRDRRGAVFTAATSALCLLLCLPLKAAAQAVPAGARAVVSADTLPVYTKMSVESPVHVTLKRGDIVTIALVVFGSDVTWCAVVKPGESRRLGYASCEFLD